MSVTDFIALDIETANADLASICSIGLAHFKSGQLFKTLTILVDPQDYFDPVNVSIHGITREMIAGKPTMAQVFPVISASLQDVIVVHHSHFDKTAMARAAVKYGAGTLPCVWLDTLRVARRAWPALNDGYGYGLARLAEHFQIVFDHHNAAEDARAAGLLMLRAVEDSGIGLEDWLARVELTLSGEVPGRHARPGDQSGPLAGEVIVFTGKLDISRSVAAEAAAKMGCDVSDSVNGRTSILVVGDQDLRRTKGSEKSSKHRKAEEMISKGAAIRIIGETDFMQMVGSEALTQTQTPVPPPIVRRTDPVLVVSMTPEASRIHHLVENVKQLKREERYIEALTLLNDEMDKQERETKTEGGVAPWYYEHAAIIYRKLGDYDREIAVLERFAAQPHFLGVGPPELLARLQKAKAKRETPDLPD